MDKTKKEISSYIDENKNELIHLISNLVQYPSTFNKEEEIQHFIKDYLTKLEGEVDIWKPDIEEMRKHPAFSSDRDDFSSSPIVVAKFTGEGTGRSLILNGHVDVVPEGGGWSKHPYSGEVDEEKIYGRGSTDMKAGMAINMFIIKMLKDLHISLKGDLILESVVDEENGSMGTLATIIRGYRADAAIIPECTDMKIFTTTIGSTWVRLTVKGKAVNLGNAHLGISAIKKAMYIIDKLDELDKERTKKLAHPMLKHIPTPFKINVGKMNAGNWPSSIPDEAILEIRYGMSPMETVEEAKEYFERFIHEISEADEWLKENPPIVEWLSTCWHPISVNENEEIIQLLSKNVSEVLETPATVTGVGYAADGAILTQYTGMPSVLFGPGIIGKAHQADEYVIIEDILKAAKAIAFTVVEWCGVKS